MSSYATNAELKNSLAAKSDLANLKAEVDKINADKLKAVHVDLSKLSNAVIKTVYDVLVTKVNKYCCSGLPAF